MAKSILCLHAYLLAQDTTESVVITIVLQSQLWTGDKEKISITFSQTWLDLLNTGWNSQYYWH